jgi:hypothetical protein
MSMAETARNDRLGFRVSATQRALLSRAAAASDKSLTDFVLESASIGDFFSQMPKLLPNLRKHLMRRPRSILVFLIYSQSQRLGSNAQSTYPN